jgi:hypothetical protein
MKKVLSALMVLALVFSMLQSAVLTASAAKSGDYEYTVTDSKATIKNYYGDIYKITIPHTLGGYPVTAIGEGVFSGREGMMSISIPSSVTSLHGNAFISFDLTSVFVDKKNTRYSSEDGILFNKSKTIIVLYPGGKTGSYAIPSNITSIGDNAFECSRLTSITIPNSVTSIGAYAFSTAAPENLTIPESVKRIGDYAFTGDDLASILVDKNNKVYSSENGVLFDNSKTVLIQYPCRKTGGYIIPRTVTRIGNGAFQSCDLSGESLLIPNGVTSIGDKAFAFVSGLKTVTIPDSVRNIGNNVFQSCFDLDDVLISNNVKSIGKYTFYCCFRLTDVTIPESVTSIGDFAFNECPALTDVSIPESVTSIGDFAFGKCTGLDKVIVPNSVIKIGEGAFEKCPALTNITIPNSVIKIGKDAFLGSEQVIINCAKDSFAYSYANENGLKYELITDQPEGTTTEALTAQTTTTEATTTADVKTTATAKTTVINKGTTVKIAAFTSIGVIVLLAFAIIVTRKKRQA